MNTPVIGLVVGLLLTLAITTGGFVGFLLAIVLGGAGFFVGRYLNGQSQGLDDLLKRGTSRNNG